MERLIIVLLLIGFVGCVGEEDEGQDFGNILDGSVGVILTIDEHPDGWGRSDCFACHPLQEIHQVDRTGTGLPLEDIRDFVNKEGLVSCPVCHGDNGVND